MNKRTINLKQAFGNIVPEKSDADFTAEIINRAQLPKTYYRKEKRRIFRPAAAGLAAALALTATVMGAANNWDYPALLNSFLHNNENAFEAMTEEPPEYDVKLNTFNGVDFELTGLYADGSTVFLTLDVISEEPVFNEKDSYYNGINKTKNAAADDYYGSSEVMSVFRDENKITLFISYYDVTESAFEDGNFKLDIEGIDCFPYSDTVKTNTVFLKGTAIIKAEVKEIPQGKILELDSTDVEGSDMRVQDIRLTPYSLNYSVTDDLSDKSGKIIAEVIDKDGKVIPQSQSVSFSGSGENKFSSFSVYRVYFDNYIETENVSRLKFKFIPDNGETEETPAVTTAAE